jgi:hypothetical protein
VRAPRTVPGWKISVEHTSAFVRTFAAYPEANHPVDYVTQERKGDRYIAATYPARVVAVSVRYQWDEKDGGFWWGQANGDIVLVSEKTGERYKTGWRHDLIRNHFSSWEATDAPDYVKAILAATHPESSITVLEVPA